MIKLMGELIPRVGPASPIGLDLVDAVKKLAKHVQPGASTPSSESNQVEALRMKQMQMAPQLAALRAQGMQQGGAPPMAPPGGGGAPPAPMGG